MRYDAIIFDFDGVIVDSEIVSNAVIAEALTKLGHAMTTEEAADRYIGLHWADTAAKIEADIGKLLPPDFKQLTGAMFQRHLNEVGAVTGIVEFLDQVRHFPKAVASSSSTQWLRTSLERFGLAHHFGDRLFSAAERVARGKPHPDIYLFAAEALGVAPERTLVIEDTAPGVTAACSAGMTVVGLCAGRHCGPNYGDRLRAAGAAYIARSYPEALEFIG